METELEENENGVVPSEGEVDGDVEDSKTPEGCVVVGVEEVGFWEKENPDEEVAGVLEKLAQSNLTGVDTASTAFFFLSLLLSMSSSEVASSPMSSSLSALAEVAEVVVVVGSADWGATAEKEKDGVVDGGLLETGKDVEIVPNWNGGKEKPICPSFFFSSLKAPWSSSFFSWASTFSFS